MPIFCSDHQLVPFSIMFGIELLVKKPVFFDSSKPKVG